MRVNTFITVFVSLLGHAFGKLTIDKPYDVSVWAAGSNQAVYFSNPDGAPVAAPLTIYLYHGSDIDNMQNLGTLASNIQPNQSPVNVFIPSDLPTSNYYAIGMKDANGVYNYSHYFTINGSTGAALPQASPATTNVAVSREAASSDVSATTSSTSSTSTSSIPSTSSTSSTSSASSTSSTSSASSTSSSSSASSASSTSSSKSASSTSSNKSAGSSSSSSSTSSANLNSPLSRGWSVGLGLAGALLWTLAFSA
ncbi:hypothetical protein AX774_g3703 [Zancudomyces culisetae]|uniref:Yeast cell wall synthesis Kre9/Knh1-like N-terminal domain-containing protein n=1 Tax=Zancudomyces culisetae TaxID=1213189 RepID=A0A1R1PNG7_ZANCU|nr:hypothetical protein AX774_g4014 [Zancudomyces culisetae]OMH82807.1 hypothetical protein AX774_g3703 [Zancudomyces culisetae]|eukprot:OMH82506.1 hypothetical protein AX774_g4014 [Zancudomyces culisetae]